MMDSMALAKAIEIQSLAREEQWRCDEDLFYLDYGLEPPRLFIWIERIFVALSTRLQAMKKADRPGWADPPAIATPAAVRPPARACSSRYSRSRS